MTREEQRHLKALDETILRAAFGLQNLLRDRAAIDPAGTQELAKEIGKTLLPKQSKRSKP